VSAPISHSSPAPQFELGRIYNRQGEIHGVYGGQRYGGIATPRDYPLVMIFSGDEGGEFGYDDEELPGGDLMYFGEGQVGDMEMTRGNLAIRDHAANGRALHLFKKIRDGYAQYAGEYEYVSDELRPNTRDREGNLRTAIAFRLTPKPLAGPATPPEIADATDAVRAIAKGQGFSPRLKAADRKAIEMRAMELATAYFASDGYDVDDVSATQPYDLRCTKGTTGVDVEVKGTTTIGEIVLLTPGEVQHALASFPDTALAVVRDIALHDAGTASANATGGTLEVHRPWRPLDTELKPVGYTYTVPDPA
jgi:hypothetical protein